MAFERIPAVFSSSIAACLLASTLSGQLKGTKTIDPSGSGPNNYRTFTDAAKDLTYYGIIGPVVFEVADGVHAESWFLGPVPGRSAFATISFRGASRVFPPRARLAAATQGQDIVTLKAGGSFLVFDYLAFESCDKAAAIRNERGATAGVDDVAIRSCYFAKTLTPTNGAIHQDDTERWVVESCSFDVTGTSIYTQRADDMTITRCVFQGQGNARCLSLWNSNFSKSRVINNEFTGTFLEAVLYFASHYETDVWHNTFRVTTTAQLIRTGSSNSYWNRFYNNVYSIQGNGAAYWIQQNQAIDSNHNLFHGGDVASIGPTRYATLSTWKAALGSQAKDGGDDGRSLVADPKFRSSTDPRLQTDSPALGKALANPRSYSPAGHEVVTDRLGLVRGSLKDLGAYELAGWRAYGVGCLGTSLPLLEITGDIAPGSVPTIQLSRARAGAPALLSLGATRASIPLAASCDVLHVPLLVIGRATDASGALGIPTIIPTSISITGVEWFLQFAIGDPLAPVGIALSNGVAVQL